MLLNIMWQSLTWIIFSLGIEGYKLSRKLMYMSNNQYLINYLNL